MIIWNIILSILLALSIGFSIYTYVITIRNKKAIMDVLAPELETHKKEILKILKISGKHTPYLKQIN